MTYRTTDATRGEPRVALVTCRRLADLEADDRLLADALARLGIRADAVVWDDPEVDYARYDLAVLRSPWDYPRRRDEFLAWARSVPRLANPAGIVSWNTDKTYLSDLAASGAPVVDTTWLAPGDPWTAPGRGEYVVKPAVGVGSIDSGRYDLGDPDQRALAMTHVVRLHDTGRTVMVQPYLSAVDTHGETALVYVDGEYTHAVRKGPMLDGPDVGVDGLYKPENITARQPSHAERAAADRVLAALPDAAELLYARVDLIPGPDGEPVLLELELTEPSLFFGYAPGSADRLAAAIARRIG
ncbi:MAG TPA: hypothetical protein VF054_17390 [Micromonosporaceae bacterium]